MLHGFTYNFTVSELVNFNILERQVNIGIRVYNLHTPPSQSKIYLYLSVQAFPHSHMCTFCLLASWLGSKRQYEFFCVTSSLVSLNVVGLPGEFHVCRVKTFSQIKLLYRDTCLLNSSVLVM